MPKTCCPKPPYTQKYSSLQFLIKHFGCLTVYEKLQTRVKRVYFTEKGFSLIEIIVVVLILGFTILTISNIPNSLRLIGSSRHESVAKEIASKKIEDARTSGYDNIVGGPFNDPRLNSLPQGTGVFTVDSCPAGVCQNNEDVKKAASKVSWLENGNPKNIEITTLISKGGLK